ncbi:PREDICTED: WAS/WASL-interacting protein family member 2-like [Sturnus vulgaris]|uniref:WAS/WASL-interacting protein family member 2-like n=1 Tax=Sturnus vulgaris TaxID=9172 RepID=UPI00071A83F5|nr:PREDICTED: WAS/WASL-interacting protein family member 2-like [Sturnus vulgaris]
MPHTQFNCKENGNSAAEHRNPTSTPQQATSGTALSSSGTPSPLTQQKRALRIKLFLTFIQLFWSTPVPQHLASLGGRRERTIRLSPGLESGEPPPPPRGRQRGRPGQGRRVLPALLSNAAGPAARPGCTGGSATSHAALTHRSSCYPGVAATPGQRHAVSAGRQSRPAPLTLAAALVLGHPRVPAGGVGGTRRAGSSACRRGERPAPRDRGAALEHGAAPARPGAAPSAVVLARTGSQDRSARRPRRAEVAVRALGGDTTSASPPFLSLLLPPPARHLGERETPPPPLTRRAGRGSAASCQASPAAARLTPPPCSGGTAHARQRHRGRGASPPPSPFRPPRRGRHRSGLRDPRASRDTGFASRPASPRPPPSPRRACIPSRPPSPQPHGHHPRAPPASPHARHPRAPPSVSPRCSRTCGGREGRRIGVGGGCCARGAGSAL